MILLREDTAMQFVQQPGKVVVKAWMDPCPYCVTFAPIFREVAEEASDIRFGEIQFPWKGSSLFRITYMRAQPGQGGVPCVFLFEDGQFKKKIHGAVDKTALKKFIGIEEVSHV